MTSTVTGNKDHLIHNYELVDFTCKTYQLQHGVMRQCQQYGPL